MSPSQPAYRVHIGNDSGLTRDDALRQLITSRGVAVDISYGETDRTFDLLIATRPDEELLLSSDTLSILLVPLAGVPEPTWRAVSSVPHVGVHTLHFNAQPVAEMALALMLAAAKGIVAADARMRDLDWTPRFVPPSSLLLGRRRALVIGFGAVGSRIARMCRALGMRVDAVRRSSGGRSEDGVQIHPASALPDLLPGTDVLFVAAPLSRETKGLIGARELALLHPESILVSVSRPEIVDEQALFHALDAGRLAAAALDIWKSEPASIDDAVGFKSSSLPFEALPNVVLSPHRAGGSGVPAVGQLRRAAVVDFIEAASVGRPLAHRERRP